MWWRHMKRSMEMNLILIMNSIQKRKTDPILLSIRWFHRCSSTTNRRILGATPILLCSSMVATSRTLVSTGIHVNITQRVNYTLLWMLQIRKISIMNPRRRRWWCVQGTINTTTNSIWIKGNIFFRCLGSGGSLFWILQGDNDDMYEEQWSPSWIQFEWKGTYSSFVALDPYSSFDAFDLGGYSFQILVLEGIKCCCWFQVLLHIYSIYWY